MIDEHIQKTESAVKNAGNISPDDKDKLLDLLGRTKEALAKLPETHDEHAKSIAELVATSAQAATRDEKNPEIIESSVQRLQHSVRDFEASHPDLVTAVNEYATFLSSIGL